MRTTVWGHSGQPGGVTPGASVSTGDHLVLVSSRGGGPINAVSLRLEPNEERVDHVWVRELPYAPDRAAGYSEGAPIPFVVAATEGLVYLVSGSGRALTAAASGGVVAETSAPGRPSALPLVVGPELLVPEGPELAAYDAATLLPRWRRPTPRGLRARPPVDGLCSLDAPRRPPGQPALVALWDIHSGGALAPRPGEARLRAHGEMAKATVRERSAGTSGKQSRLVDLPARRVVPKMQRPSVSYGRVASGSVEPPHRIRPPHSRHR